MVNFMKGKKTYIVALVAAGCAAAQVFGYTIPDFVWPLLGAAGLGAVRNAVAAA